MPSFGGVEFEERGDGSNFTRWSREAAMSVTHIPGGDRSVIQVAGRKARTLQLTVRCTPAQYDDLAALVGQRRQLDAANTTTFAVLESISGADVGRNGNYVFAAVKFTENL